MITKQSILDSISFKQELCEDIVIPAKTEEQADQEAEAEAQQKAAQVIAMAHGMGFCV